MGGYLGQMRSISGFLIIVFLQDIGYDSNDMQADFTQIKW